MNPEKNNHHRSLSGNRPQGLMADIISEVNIYKLPIPESDHQQQGSAGPGSTTSTSTNSSKFKPQVTPLVMSHSRSRSKSEEIFSAGIISPLSVQEQMIAGTTTLGSATPPRRINSASSTPPVSASHSRSPSGNNNQILPNSYGVGKRGHSRTHSMGRPETTDFTLQRQSSKETLTEITNSFQLRQRNNNNTDLDVSPSSDADDSRRSIVFTKKPRKPSIFKVLEKRSFSEVVWDALVSPSFFLILFLLISLGYTWKTKEEHLEQWKIKYQDVHNNHQDLKYTHEVITADLREWKEKQSETVGKLEMLLDERKSILKELDTYKAKLGDAQADTSKPSVDRSQRARHLREEHSRKMREYVRSNDKKLQSDPKSRPDSGGQVSKIINHERQAGMSEEDLERKLAEEEDAIESLETKEEDRESLSNEIKEGSSSSSPIHHRQLSSVSNLDSLLHKGEDLTVIAAARAKYHEEVAEMDLQDIQKLVDSEDDDGPEPEGLKSMPPRKDRKQARDDKAEMPLHPIKFEVLPPSSVWCTGDSKKNRICRFRNVCYKPDNQKWFIFQTNRTIQHNVPVHRYADQLLELTTMDGHPKYYWNFDEASPFDEQFKNVEIRYETAPHFIFSRVSPDNIFHTFHDDIIGLYFMLKEYMGEGVFGNEFSFMSPYRFLFFDDHGVAKNDHLFQTLAGDRALRYKSYLHYDSHITCFQEAVFGNSKIGTWYQYGFKNPEGPIPYKHFNGNFIREVAEFYMRQNHINLAPEEHLFLPAEVPIHSPRLSEAEKPNREPLLRPGSAMRSGVDKADLDLEGTDLTIVLARKSNRLITNHDDLVAKLKEKFEYEVIVLVNDPEKFSFKQQIEYMRRARVVVGMHSSLMIMTMFCRRGTVLVEMLPLGLQPTANHGENMYSQFKTLAGMPGMDLVYRLWVNTDETKTITYPNRHSSHGGLKHLDEAERDRISSLQVVPPHLCCSDASRLYRMYQDTIVDVDWIVMLVIKGLLESRKRIVEPIKRGDWHWAATEILPPAVEGIRCLYLDNRPKGVVWVEWDKPWNGARVEKFSVYCVNNGKEYIAEQTSMVLDDGFKEGDEVVFLIRPLLGQFKGEFHNIGRCIA